MRVFTYGTTPKAVISEVIPSHYNMNLNRGDMMNLLEVLLYADGMLGDSQTGDLGEWAHGMRTSLLETIGIEEV